MTKQGDRSIDEIEKIRNLIESNKIIGRSGSIVFDYANFKSCVFSKDIIGNTIQDWFGQWLISKDLTWEMGAHSQSWPDFILSDGTHLEVKTFDSEAGPNFDLANFDAFIRSLWDGNVGRLDTPHLVFSYISNPDTGVITIDDFWVKNMWELTGPSPKNILSLQVKQSQPVNIRPKNWRSPRVQLFSSRKEFVLALSQAVTKYRDSQFPDWYKVVEDHYTSKFNQPL